MKGQKVLYAEVILPIRFTDAIFYTIDETLTESLGLSAGNFSDLAGSLIGRRVSVTFASKRYSGVIRRVLASASQIPPQPSASTPRKRIEVKPIEGFEKKSAVSPWELRFWETIAEYYMCSIGEVYAAAYPKLSVKQEKVNSKLTPQALLERIKKDNNYAQIELSSAQAKALEEIKAQIDSKCVLLHGVPGSGKTEIYITLAKEVIASGKNVLYLVPEIAMSSQLEERIKEHFGERVLPYHSGLTQARRKLLRSMLQQRQESLVVLGTRSSILLPLNNLGLIIVDEEHDASYKQDEPAPRYNARDAALFLSKIQSCKVLLGSATPSLETLYNCSKGLYAKVNLTERYFSSHKPDVIVIDTLYARKTGQMKGALSQGLINRLKQTVAKGEQAIIFSHLRSYAPFVICSECGEVLRCPRCNVPLSYHKFSDMLTCHYCEYTVPFKKVATCPKCGKENSLQLGGAGSEKIEEELQTLLPQARIARYDADTAASKTLGAEVLAKFAQGEIDILVGTQMITKGFDFDNVTLVAVVQTDTLLAQQDFRADEKALALLSQLMGRSGRREKTGLFIIQTSSKNHPVIKRIAETSAVTDELTSFGKERKAFGFPPYVRLINITLRNKNLRVLSEESAELVRALKINLGNALADISGPYTPKLERVKEAHQMEIGLKLPRTPQLKTTKRNLAHILKALNFKSQAIVDVDPL